MTTDLEKQFFSTFGIKPKKGCTAYDKLEEHEADTICDDECLECLYFDDIYPKITSDKLLGLICLLSAYFSLEQENWFRKCTSIKELKDWVLKAFIEVEKRSISIIPRYHVQALFKEE